jgi:hypothetical protein
LGGEQLGLAGPDINSGFDLLLEGVPGQVYGIETSTNFTNWAEMTSITNTWGIVDFLDNSATSNGLRFYRAHVIPQ